MEFYILDKELNTAGVIDSYKEIIWANRYIEIGDCQLQVPATVENLQLLQIGFYIMRIDDEMVCKIVKIEVDTSIDEGNYLIVTGRDVKSMLDQRIVWGIKNYNTTYEAIIRSMITDSCISPTNSNRRFRNSTLDILSLGTAAGFSDTVKEQISYKNVGEKIREICTMKKWGYKIVLNSVNESFLFYLYRGTDKSSTVSFSPGFDNLKDSQFAVDYTNMGNVTLIGGQGEGSARILADVGASSSTNRFEFFTDAKDIPNTITWAELKKAYPEYPAGNGQIKISGGTSYYYEVSSIYFDVFSETQLEMLKDYYQGDEIKDSQGNVIGYQARNAIIADVPSASPSLDDSVELREPLYINYLIQRGLEKIAEHGEVTEFNGTVITGYMFEYRVDYNLGDVVLVSDEYGNSKKVRVIEALENDSANGYTLEIKFEDIEQEAV